MQTFTIKSYFGKTIIRRRAKSLKNAIENSVAEKIYLQRVNLCGADLRGANLRNRMYFRNSFLHDKRRSKRILKIRGATKNEYFTKMFYTNFS
jgi:uncharacterized protein YjbI with pentapeptide repeats